MNNSHQNRTKNQSTSLEESDDVVCCPYNKSHRVVKSRLMWHIGKCKSANSQSGKFGHCRYNYTHIMLVEQLMHHETKDCRDRPEKVKREDDRGDQGIADEAFKEWKRKQNKEEKDKNRKKQKDNAIPEVEKEEEEEQKLEQLLDFELQLNKNSLNESHFQNLSQNVSQNWLKQNSIQQKPNLLKRRLSNDSSNSRENSIDSDDSRIVSQNYIQKGGRQEEEEEEYKQRVNNNILDSSSILSCKREIMDDASFQMYKEKRKQDKAARRKLMQGNKDQLKQIQPNKLVRKEENRGRSDSNSSIDSDNDVSRQSSNSQIKQDSSQLSAELSFARPFEKKEFNRKNFNQPKTSNRSSSSSSSEDSGSDPDIQKNPRKLPFPYGKANFLNDSKMNSSVSFDNYDSQQKVSQQQIKPRPAIPKKNQSETSSDSEQTSSDGEESSGVQQYQWKERKEKIQPDSIYIEQSIDASQQHLEGLVREQEQQKDVMPEDLSEDEDRPVQYISRSEQKQKPEKYLRRHVQLHNLTEKERENYEQLQVQLEQELPSSAIRGTRGNRELNSDSGRPRVNSKGKYNSNNNNNSNRRRNPNNRFQNEQEGSQIHERQQFESEQSNSSQSSIRGTRVRRN